MPCPKYLLKTYRNVQVQCDSCSQILNIPFYQFIKEQQKKKLFLPPKGIKCYVSIICMFSHQLKISIIATIITCGFLLFFKKTCIFVKFDTLFEIWKKTLIRLRNMSKMLTLPQQHIFSLLTHLGGCLFAYFYFWLVHSTKIYYLFELLNSGKLIR